MLHASLFISTYNMSRHLELVLEGVIRQSFTHFEILICDDGSNTETRDLVRKFMTKTQIPIRHFWQEHQGFRKCRILNQALRAAQGEICIFLDGDCIPHEHFVFDHVKYSERGRYLAGRRVELGQKFSSTITPEMVKDGFFDGPTFKLLQSVRAGDSEHFQRSLRVEARWLRRVMKMTKVDDLKGCNYSVSRAALEEINGFDEDYEGYGREDTDVEIRLQNLGLTIKSMKGLALQYHVWHERRAFTPKNDDRLELLKASKRYRCEKGLVQIKQ